MCGGIVLISILSNTFARIDAVSPFSHYCAIRSLNVYFQPYLRMRTRRYCLTLFLLHRVMADLLCPVPLPIHHHHSRRVLSIFVVNKFRQSDSFYNHRMKSDALFSYQPPFNLLAFAILWPASLVLSPRSLHTANVFLIRLTVCHLPSSPALVSLDLR